MVRTRVGLFVLVGIAATFWPASAAAGDEFPRTTLGRAASCYYALDYDCVVELLETLPTDYPAAASGQIPGGLRPLDLPLLLEAGRILAVARLALGDEASARAVFAWLLEIDSEFLITGTEVPPRFFAVFYDVRAQVLAPPLAAWLGIRSQGLAVARGRAVSARETATRVAALPKPPELLPRLPEPLLLSVSAGARWVELTRDDARVFGAALGFLGRGELVFDEFWTAGVEIGVSVHPVRLDNLLESADSDLRILTVVLHGGLQWHVIDDWAIAPRLAAGLATYGTTAWAQRSGPAIGAQLVSEVSVLRPLTVAFEAGALSVTPLQGEPRASVVLHAGVTIGALF